MSSESSKVESAFKKAENNRRFSRSGEIMFADLD